MKIWITNKKTKEKEAIDVSFWSLLKANFITSLVMGLLFWAGFFLLGLILLMFG